MFILTTKISKRKIIAVLLALAVIVAAVIILTSGGSDDDNVDVLSISGAVKSNKQRVAYLESFGWEVTEEPIDTQTITIPNNFSDVYASYNELQKQQGFDLEKYCGLEAVRYTYEVRNHPTAKGQVVADIIIYRNQVIAGDIQSIALDGFMSGLEFPKESESN